MSDILQRLAPLAVDINQAMERLIAEDLELAGQVGRYNFDGGGKRLRPLMFCLALKAAGREVDARFLDVSTSFEFLHMATLLHDDIVDQAETRRGRRAAHLVFGVPETVLAGDYFLAKAAILGARSDSLECARLMAEVVAALSLGELIQLQSRGRADLSEEEYFQIIYRKTAVLMEGSAKSAGLLSGAGEDATLALAAYGRQVGLAFQIMDDVLDYQSDAETFGKPVGHDLDEGKITLPFILARESLGPAEAERLMALGSAPERSADDRAEILALVDAGRGVPQAQGRAKVFTGEAVAALAVLPPGQARDDLAELAWHMVERLF